MFARNTGDPSSRLRVEMTYSLNKYVRTAASYTLAAGSSWAPTPEISTLGTLAPPIGNFIPTSIQVRIAPLDTRGQWQIDDFYVDPFARH